MPRSSQLLIVDDNVATRYAMRRVLERQGFTTLEAGTGAEGLALLAENPVDALILDVNLPDMSGLDIVRQLRAEPGTELLPIVHVSAASVATGDQVTGLEGGADAYLIHPVEPGILVATLRTLMRVRDTEQALLESEARFREIFTQIAEPIAVIDARLKVHDRNEAFLRLVGAEAEDGLLGDIFEEGQAQALDELRAHLATARRWRGILLMHNRRGGRREVEWRVAPYRSPDLGLVFLADVTEQRLHERLRLAQLDSANTELALQIAGRERAESQLAQAQKMDALGKLTGGIAHDFNNLLTSIITGIELINRHMESGQTAQIQRFTDTVLSAARRAATLTHRLLAFARQQPLAAQPVDVNERVRSLEDLLRRTIGERIALQLRLAPEPLVARVDAGQLESAIINLVINARDALPAGGAIHIETALREVAGDAELAEGSYVEVAVVDNGTGIALEVLDKVFEPFFTTKPVGKGTGLGLSMIYGFARQSGGRVGIDSEPGQGTRVVILLPPGEVPAQPGETGDEAPLLAGAGERLLLVEDAKSVRDLVSTLLTDAGYECTVAADADAALRVLRGDDSVDLLLIDVGLPGMNGLEFAEVARAWRPRLPMLFVTGYAGSADALREILDTGMNLVTKPFEADELLRTVRSMLR